MTATQLLERLATSMMAGAFGDSVADAFGATMSKSETCPVVDADMDEDKNESNMLLLELPNVVLEHVCSFLDHTSLHSVEASSAAFYNLAKQSDLWMDLALRNVAVGELIGSSQYSWKQMLCLSSTACNEDNHLIKGVEAYSSADRASETPGNTLKPSRCWRDFKMFTHKDSLNHLHEFHDVPTFVMSLGERIQRRCGCSSGNSCYWSSSASPDKNATDYIDYVLDGQCVISAVQILPYRVFWHPGSPTYGPQCIRIEFYESTSVDTFDDADANGQVVPQAREICPFFQSPVYPVVNDMDLQSFVLPKRVWASGRTVMRIHLLGRHQAQTFELPQWLQQTEEDRLPKYYCCLSYVNALGLSSQTLLSPHPVSPSRKRLRESMNASSVSVTLADIMAACLETVMEQQRRLQLLGSPAG